MQNKKEIDRVWLMRNIVRINEEDAKNNRIEENNLDAKVIEYVNEFGLPSGYLSIDELFKDIKNIMANPSINIIRR